MHYKPTPSIRAVLRKIAHGRLIRSMYGTDLKGKVKCQKTQTTTTAMAHPQLMYATGWRGILKISEPNLTSTRHSQIREANISHEKRPIVVFLSLHGGCTV